MACHGDDEVEKKMVEGGEVEIFLGEVEKIFWWKIGEENGKKRKERKRKKEKGKEIGKGKIFSWKRK